MRILQSSVFQRWLAWSAAAIVAGICVFAAVVECLRHDEGNESIRNAAEGPCERETRRQREEACIRWLREHNVTGKKFIALNPYRETDRLEWHEKYLDIFQNANLSDPTIRDTDLHYVSMLPNLSWIHLNTDTTKLSGDGLRQLVHKKLLGVTFNGKADVPPSWVNNLEAHPEIRTWEFQAPVTDQVILILDNGQSRVKSLVLSNATSLTDKGFQAIGRLKELDVLYVCRLSSVADAQLRSITRCRKLRELVFFAIDAKMELSSKTADMITAMPDLEQLTLSSDSSHSPKALAAFGGKSWKYISLTFPAMRAKAEREGKTLYDMTRELIREAEDGVAGRR